MVLIKKIVLSVVAATYVASLFSLVAPFALRDGIFVSPDEHATWTFAERIANTGKAQEEEARNIWAKGMLHPRSTVTVGEMIVPASFLGLTYVAGALFFVSPYLAASTGPLFGVLGLVALYSIVRRMKGSQEFALYTVIALAVHPVWWYYSMRSLMPNVPFVALVLGAIWCALVAYQEKSGKKYPLWVSAGCALGLALAMRPSEWVWMLGCGLAGVCFMAYKHKEALRDMMMKRKKEIACLLVGVGAIGGIMLALQAVVYGEPLATGYTVDRQVWEVGNALGESVSVTWYEKFFAALFPFGIHERATLSNVWRYVFALYPWMTGIGVLGAALLLARREVQYWARSVVGHVRGDEQKKRISAGEIKKYLPLIACVVLCTGSLAYLLILYGSWVFYDNPDPSVISLGNSHTRYWLPVFVALAPAVAYALLRGKAYLLTWAKSARAKKYVHAFPSVVLVLLAACSAHVVFWGDDGVVHAREVLPTFAEKRSALLTATPEQAIIIVDRADKYLWPDRAVVVPLRSAETYAIIPRLVEGAPVYYFGITLPEEDLTHLHEVVFAQEHIVFTPIVTLQEETLYEITRQ